MKETYFRIIFICFIATVLVQVFYGKDYFSSGTCFSYAKKHIFTQNMTSLTTESNKGGQNVRTDHPGNQKLTAMQKPNTPTPRPDICTSCFNRPFSFKINSPEVCLGPKNTSIELLLLIFTTKTGLKRRNAIRKTWTSTSKNNTSPRFRYVFLLGSSEAASEKLLQQENDIYHDIALQDFKDTYKNLTLKTLMGLEWFSKFCAQARFVMKTDDDMYVNVMNILRIVNSTDLQDKVFGACALTAGPIRGNSKYGAKLWEYPHNSYPGFCSGTGYVMSAKMAKSILNISPHVPFFFLEDVYVSICVRKLGYKLKPVRGFNSGLVRYTNGVCGIYGNKHMFTSHEVTPDKMLSIWESCKNRLKM